MSGIVISAASRDDIPDIHAMLRALGEALLRADGIKSTEDDLARFGFGAAPAFEAIIARRDGAAVGLAIYFYEFSTWRGFPGVYVQDLYVDTALRGSGLGRRLLATVAAHASAREARYLRLSVHAGNDGGFAFYERLGFTAPNEQLLVLDDDAFAALSRSETQ